MLLNWRAEHRSRFSLLLLSQSLSTTTTAAFHSNADAQNMFYHSVWIIPILTVYFERYVYFHSSTFAHFSCDSAAICTTTPPLKCAFFGLNYSKEINVEKSSSSWCDPKDEISHLHCVTVAKQTQSEKPKTKSNSHCVFVSVWIKWT